MNIREKVARAIGDNQRFVWGFNYDRALLSDKKQCDEIATAAITAFLEAAAEEGWRMHRDEATDKMRKAGRQSLRDAGLLPAYTDATSGANGVVQKPILHEMLGPLYCDMHAAEPPLEWDK